tara:strand:+ start:175 stop:402 length:228 start_codon:yes stop_codon:yes gene_type:complete
MNNYTLNDAQMVVLQEVADAELRSQEQMMSLLLAEALRFYFCDYDSPHGRVDHAKLETFMTRDAKELVNDRTKED